MEGKEKNRVTVSIMGEEFILRSTSSIEEIQRVSSYVDRLMRSIAEKNMQMNRHKVAILAALNLADELLRLKEEKNHLISEEAKSGEDLD
ncbi:MAG: cell division protein ZapA [Bacillota bacterium]|nr:cell division protein ZapA [Bacillota bacterium]